MKKDHKINLIFVLECIELIESYLKDINQVEFMKSTKLQDAIIRRIELIGEATKNLPKSLKDKYPDVQWKRITGMRDILVHDYMGIDLNVAWKVASIEVPQLKQKLLKIIADLESGVRLD